MSISFEAEVVVNNVLGNSKGSSWGWLTVENVPYRLSVVISLDDVLVLGEVTSFYSCLWDKTYRLVVVPH